MQTYTIHQNNCVRHLSHAINKHGWDNASKRWPEVNTHLECTFKGSEGFKPEMFKHYTFVASITAIDLEDVFRVGNIGPEEQIKRRAPMHSLSVGDIVETPAGEYFMVDGIGFTQIEVTK
jgi:hypothetical protein